jgi:hypothetical protein
MAVLAGLASFAAEVLAWRGLVVYYVLFVIQLETRRVTVTGITRQRGGSSSRTLSYRHGCGRLGEPAVLTARSRHEVLCRAPMSSSRRTSGTAAASAEISEPERVRRTGGALCQTGMSVEADRPRREFAHTRFERLCCALPLLEESSGQGNVLLFSAPSDIANLGHRFVCRKRLGACSATTPAGMRTLTITEL